MALVTCQECGKSISSDARSCPNCGKPIRERDVVKIVLGIIAVLYGLGAGAVGVKHGWFFLVCGIVIIYAGARPQRTGGDPDANKEFEQKINRFFAWLDTIKPLAWVGSFIAVIAGLFLLDGFTILALVLCIGGLFLISRSNQTIKPLNLVGSALAVGGGLVTLRELIHLSVYDLWWGLPMLVIGLILRDRALKQSASEQTEGSEAPARKDP